MKIGNIVFNMEKSISDFVGALDEKGVKDVTVEHGYTPAFDRTCIFLCVEFSDETQAIIPVGWYQGEPNLTDTVGYANGEICGIFGK